MPAEPASVRDLRRRAAAFAEEAGAGEAVRHAVALAVSEVVTNVVLHAYAGSDAPGAVRLACRDDGGRLTVEVADDGGGIAARDDSPGLGHGLALVGGLASELRVQAGPHGRGTVVTMTFGATGPPGIDAALEDLCELALEAVADVSCVDVVHGGVLRRAAALVLGDHALTAWLRGATPPAKPGTATWAALREGGTQLVVHDPSLPRSPGGTGERLGLEWWVAVPLEGADGQPAALWGLGGRAGGRPAPGPPVLAALGAAARGDLSREAQRSALRARLAPRG